jgi:hypothetical protein
MVKSRRKPAVLSGNLKSEGGHDNKCPDRDIYCPSVREQEFEALIKARKEGVLSAH